MRAGRERQGILFLGVGLMSREECLDLYDELDGVEPSLLAILADRGKTAGYTDAQWLRGALAAPARQAARTWAGSRTSVIPNRKHHVSIPRSTMHQVFLFEQRTMRHATLPKQKWV